MKKSILAKLARLATTLDDKGLFKEASTLRKLADKDEGPSIKLYCPQCKKEMGELGEKATNDACKAHEHKLGYWVTSPEGGATSKP